MNRAYKVLTATRSLLLVASKYKKPSEQDITHLFAEPLSLASHLSDVTRGKGRYAALLQLISVAAPAFSCIFVCWKSMFP